MPRTNKSKGVPRAGGVMTWDEIGRELGISGSRAAYICSEALRKLRTHPVIIAYLKSLADSKEGLRYG